MDRIDRKALPLMYSCSGCSNLAQLANDVAVHLDRTGAVEMSCIAGVGGDVPALVRIATSGRPIVAIDGCALQCVRHTLARHGVTPAAHHVLTERGLRKQQHADLRLEDVPELVADVRASVDTVAGSAVPRDGGIARASGAHRGGDLLDG